MEGGIAVWELNPNDGGELTSVAVFEKQIPTGGGELSKRD